MIPGDGMRIDVAFSTGPDDTAPAYEEITDRVLMSPGISLSRGRSPEGGAVSTGTCSMTLKNDDGRFTAENPASPYFPNVKLGRKLQVSYRDPATLGRYNLVPAATSDVEDGLLTGWWNNYFGAAAASTIASSTVRAFSGSKSVLVTWPTAASTNVAAGWFLPSKTLRKGRTYVAAVPVFVPAGSPAVRFGDVFGSTPAVTSTVSDRWQILRVSWVATGYDVYLGVKVASNPTAGQQVWLDAARVDEAAPGQFPATSVDAGRINLSPDPRMKTSAVNSNNPATWSVVRNSVINGPQGITTGARVEPLTAGSTSLASVFNVDGLGATAVSRGVGAWVYSTKAANVTMAAAGPAADSKITAIPAATWVFCTNALPDTGHLTLSVASTVGNAVPGTDFVYVTGGIGEEGAVPTGFFDGAIANEHPGVPLIPTGGFSPVGAATITAGQSFAGRDDWTRVATTVANVGGRQLYPIAAFSSQRSYVVKLEVGNDSATTRTLITDIADGIPEGSVTVAPGETEVVSFTVPAGPSADPNPTVYRFLDVRLDAAGELLVRVRSVAPAAPVLSAWCGTALASASQQFLEPFTTLQSFAVGGPVKRRFTGYVDDWPVEWPSGPSLSRVAIVATDRLKRIAGRRKLRSIVEEEILAADPTAYFPLGESEGSATAGDVSGMGRVPGLSIAQIGTGGTVDFGLGTGAGTDGLTAPVFTAASSTNGKTLTCQTTGKAFNVDAGLGIPINLSLAATVATTGTSSRIVEVRESFGQGLALEVSAAGKLAVRAFNPWSGAADVVVTSAGSINDGATHVVALTATVSTVTAYIDGVSVGSASLAALWSTWLPPMTRLTVGGAPGLLFTGTIGHVAVFDQALAAAVVAGISSAARTGFAGERSDQRVDRLLGYAGVPSSDRALDVGLSTNIDHVDTTNASALDIGQRVTDTENGVLLVDRDGRVAFHGRGRRYNAAPKAGLDSSQIRPGLTFSYNDQQLANDVTARRLTGYTFRAVNAQSIADHGVATGTGDLDLVCGTDAEVEAAAAWRVATRAVPSSRLPSAVVDLLDDVVRELMVDVEISDRFVASGLLSQAPAKFVDLFVEGYTETISDSAWDLVLNTSPASLASNVWQIEHPVYGQVDADNRIAY